MAFEVPLKSTFLEVTISPSLSAEINTQVALTDHVAIIVKEIEIHRRIFPRRDSQSTSNS